jgi:hypothetical protein
VLRGINLSREKIVWIVVRWVMCVRSVDCVDIAKRDVADNSVMYLTIVLYSDAVINVTREISLRGVITVLLDVIVAIAEIRKGCIRRWLVVICVRRER